LLSTIDNQELSGQFHGARLKHVVLRGRQCENLTSIDQLRSQYNKLALQKAKVIETDNEHDFVIIELDANQVVFLMTN